MSFHFTLAQTDEIGVAIAAVIQPGDCIGLVGDLGAGKTTLARSILGALGLKGEAPSPSFAIVQHYAPPETSMPVLHVDLYRIDDAAEIAELGLDEARDDHVLLIEWPERMGTSMWSDMMRLQIDFDGEDARRLTALVPPAWEGRWPFPQ
ncbi:tRNA (adenosine(37)-N6)-threonylcarbamoyltransferase complex ATPase subunit type 1 TsaE [Sphingomonas lacunae]|uniref:tRNA threonylcarbamoyladenosine biosynthesis protein TsaE n=1 Tax=Sphingomonas lacunae TaxID=2698828 RepID=A0A6M4AV81_9SPHN|nr:tRNA (adenosine(37)-N6)-threonylcarbamoyltransferase complex ATPase subunit type 1 TsaE [Sphingomonas lacunae]QJQ33015.1 tRNA (adenosine(37)-N6)-threonylcarbamoyltransferase complex ATPase subunit type 1 TsaE [Sphingomonas lacunae]